ncbi:MAG TPA: Arm DNA-binding domain-containing protein, partial [Rhizomicrobium sp.]|nr:Arm DNA-binding domain-containing protein [Rhizomicrobium sp.]
MRLTDLSIKSLKAPEKGAIIYHDDILTGFGVRVSEGGTKSFVLTHGVLRRRETIGRVGILGLQSARTEAKRRLAEYTLGKAQPRVVPWNAALEEYLKELGAARKARTHRDYSRILRKHFRFGDLKLPQLSQADIERKLERLSDTPSEQHHAFVVLRTFLRWAHRKSYVD